MSIKKKTLKNKPVCKATFKLDKKLANGAKKAFVVGDFNEWNPKADEMKALKDGSFTIYNRLRKQQRLCFPLLIGRKRLGKR